MLALVLLESLGLLDYTLALQTSSVTLEPAQLRTSVAKRFGSGSSYVMN